MTIQVRFLQFSKLLCRNLVTYPLCSVHSHYLLEGNAERIVTTETTLIGQLLDGHRLMGRNCLMVEVDEVLDAQTVDVFIITDTLQGKVLAEVGTIDANLIGELGQGNVVMQI